MKKLNKELLIERVAKKWENKFNSELLTNEELNQFHKELRELNISNIEVISKMKWEK